MYISFRETLEELMDLLNWLRFEDLSNRDQLVPGESNVI